MIAIWYIYVQRQTVLGLWLNGLVTEQCRETFVVRRRKVEVRTGGSVLARIDHHVR